ncbi:hypothetical protein QTP86_010750 [Hemibagrus guttatus]|nr:hypothetical protein QTP86_010750 [Hemibagrus guttatus]
MGRGSPIPPMLRRKIVEQYQKGVSQRKIAKSLKLSSSTVHNIIQRFRESGTISVRKGQGRKTILDARDLRALRRHCITYRNATVMEITTWAQEYFQKTLSVNTIHRAIRCCRLKPYRSKKKPYLNMIQKRRHFLWAKAHLKWTVAKWKTVLWSDESKFEVLFGKLGRHVIRTKEDKDNPSCYQRSVQKPASLMVWGCMSACGMGSLHIWKGTINAERSGRPTKITPRAQRQLIQEVTKDPTTTFKELQASLASVKASVHDSTIRKRLGKNGLHGRVPRRKPLLSKKNIKARLSFARKHLDDPQDFWENTLWTDETKIELLGRSVSHYVWRKSNTAFQIKIIIPTVKYGGGSVMVCGCFAASGPGRLAVINGTMNSAVYQKILKENVRSSVCDLKLKQTWVLQQDNDPKHTSKSTSEWLKKNKMKTLEWPSQSPDLNPIEMLWHDLKKVVHAQKPSNVAELQHFCKDEWAKIPPQRCNRLVASYGKRLIAVVAAKGGPTSY